MLSRRQFVLNGLAAGAALTVFPRLAIADARRPRLVLVILRGGLDGLHAAPPVGDPGYASLRGQHALALDGETPALKLDGLFALHPSLINLHEMAGRGEATLLHAVASPYRERSHFDAQDVLENGSAIAHGLDSGWLNRAVAGLPGTGERAVALAPTLPLVLRGPSPVSNWSPSKLPGPDDDFLRRVDHLYQTDPQLAEALARAREINLMASASGGAMTSSMADTASAGAAKAGVASTLAQAAAQFLVDPQGPSVAVLDLSGWDSHVGAFGPQSGLSKNLASLDAGLAALKAGLGPAWRDTVVLVATEFGRTARPNGTEGTDHGTGAAAFLLGGALRPMAVRADWPGLRDAALYQGRDLQPTTDLRTVAKGVLLEHLRLPEATLDTAVFPDSRGVKPMSGLV